MYFVFTLSVYSPFLGGKPSRDPIGASSVRVLSCISCILNPKITERHPSKASLGLSVLNCAWQAPGALRSTEDEKLRSSRACIIIRWGRIDSWPRPCCVCRPYHDRYLLKGRFTIAIRLERNRFRRVHRDRILRHENVREPSIDAGEQSTAETLTVSSNLPRRQVG